MGKSQKGSEFERSICKQLSLWWTQDEEPPRSDVFWRTAASGGRATQRNKTGQRTFGQYGDIQAVDPIGAPLMRVVTLECKRGYSDTSFIDALDRDGLSTQQPWEAFVEQAETASKLSDSVSWMLLQRRNKRQTLAFFPRSLFEMLKGEGAFAERPSIFVSMRVRVRVTDTRKVLPLSVVVLKLSDLLRLATPQHFKNLAL